MIKYNNSMYCTEPPSISDDAEPEWVAYELDEREYDLAQIKSEMDLEDLALKELIKYESKGNIMQ